MSCVKDFDDAVLCTGPAVVARHRGVGGVGGVGKCADGIKQLGLVRLQLNQNVVAGVACNFKCFFDSAWRPW